MRQPDLAHCLEPGAGAAWAVLDTAMVRQENMPETELNRLLAGWSVVRDETMNLNLPTLLDLAPEAATGAAPSATAQLRLLRRSGGRNDR